MIDNCIMYYVIQVIQANEFKLNSNQINFAIPVFLQCLPMYYITDMGNNQILKTWNYIKPDSLIAKVLLSLLLLLILLLRIKELNFKSDSDSESEYTFEWAWNR